MTSLNYTEHNGYLTITWDPPHTLNITGVEPDIAGYCVKVVNSTSREILHFECEITETQFSYPTPPDADCHLYVFTVIPVNEVGNGSMSSILYAKTEICMLS